MKRGGKNESQRAKRIYAGRSVAPGFCCVDGSHSDGGCAARRRKWNEHRLRRNQYLVPPPDGRAYGPLHRHRLAGPCAHHTDILLLGGYYILVILGYLIFEMIPINYRPILINGAMEASYPSSTTLLVLSVMPTLLFQVNRRAKRQTVRRMAAAFVVLFSAFMVIGRLVAGVHWLTDIVGSVLLSAGLYALYRAAVLAMEV